MCSVRDDEPDGPQLLRAGLPVLGQLHSRVFKRPPTGAAMTDRNLTVARLVEDEIESVKIKGGAFGELLSELGVSPKIEKRAIVTSAKPGDDDTRAYIVSVHAVPGTDGATRVYACTCSGFKFHQLLSNADAIRNDPETGFERLGRCKHGDELAVADRSTEDREAGQQGFSAFSTGEKQ